MSVLHTCFHANAESLLYCYIQVSEEGRYYNLDLEACAWLESCHLEARLCLWRVDAEDVWDWICINVVQT